MSIDLPSLQPLAHHPDLVAPTFSADAFLLSRSHIPLEELRGELREYLGVLREELTQLINDDYEEFIALGIGLRGEEERLKGLGEPLEQAKERVEEVKARLDEMQRELQVKLDERAAVREEKALLLNMQKLLDTLTRAEGLVDGTAKREARTEDQPWKRVSRLANECSQIKYLLHKVVVRQADAASSEFAADVQPRVTRLQINILAQVSTLFSAAIREMDREQIQASMKLYEMMDGVEDGMAVVREVVDNICQQTLTLIPAGSSNSADARIPGSTQLSAAYNRFLNEVDSLSALLDAGAEAGWDIVVDIIWPAVMSAIRTRLGGSIFSAGRPDELHQNFTTTRHLIDALEALCSSADAVERMRAHSATDELRRQWQLPVYFQLRWKEIVGRLEQKLAMASTAQTPVQGQRQVTGASVEEQEQDWVLPQSPAVWEAVQACWDDKVYLPELGGRFLRLTLQILSRFETSLALPKDDTSDEILQRAAASLIDITKLNRHTKQLVPEDIDVTLNTAQYETIILTCLSTRALEPLKMVRSVASQIRATPRPPNARSRPSDFIKLITSPLSSLISSHPALKPWQTAWAERLAAEVCTNYASTLVGVRKTEDLLKRHRKIKKTGFSLFGGGAAAEGAGDDGAFDAQMKTDIEALGAALEELGVDVGASEDFGKLREALTASLEE